MTNNLPIILLALVALHLSNEAFALPMHLLTNTYQNGQVMVPLSIHTGQNRQEIHYGRAEDFINNGFLQPIGDQPTAGQMFQNLKGYFSQPGRDIKVPPTPGTWEGRCLTHHSLWGYPQQRSYSNAASGYATVMQVGQPTSFVRWGDTQFPWNASEGAGIVNQNFPEITRDELGRQTVTGTTRSQVEMKMFPGADQNPLMVIRVRTEHTSPSAISPHWQENLCIYAKSIQNLPAGVQAPVAAAVASAQPVIAPFYQRLLAGAALPRQPQFQVPQIPQIPQYYSPYPQNPFSQSPFGNYQAYIPPLLSPQQRSLPIDSFGNYRPQYNPYAFSRQQYYPRAFAIPRFNYSTFR